MLTHNASLTLCFLSTTKTRIFLSCWGLTTRQTFWVILCRLPEKGGREIEEIEAETKERDRRRKSKINKSEETE